MTTIYTAKQIHTMQLEAGPRCDYCGLCREEVLEMGSLMGIKQPICCETPVIEE